MVQNSQTDQAHSDQTQSETDEFVSSVCEQVEQNTFDPTNHALLKQMVESLSDPRGMVRLTIVETFGKIGEPATPFLVDGLSHHPNPVVRRSCAKGLAILANPVAIPNLINSLLNDEDTVVRGSSAGALARVGEAAIPALLTIIESPEHSSSAKGQVAWALAFMGADCKEALHKAIASDSDEIRAAVVGALSKVAQEAPTEDTLTLLIEALSDQASIVRNEAAIALSSAEYKPAIPHLIKLLASEEEDRKSAALALMKLDDGTSLDSLNTALQKESVDSIQAVIKLAINQIEQRLSNDADLG